MSLKRHAAGFVRETRAAALVEFTLVFPLLLVFLAGLSELGFAMHQQHIVQKAVRDAARYAARTNYALKSCPLSTQHALCRRRSLAGDRPLRFRDSGGALGNLGGPLT